MTSTTSATRTTSTAIFSTSGDRIIVTFAAHTASQLVQRGNHASQVTCDKLFRNAKTLFGPASCTWVKLRTVEVSLGVGATVVPTSRKSCREPFSELPDELVVRPGAVRPTADNDADKRNICVPVHAPANPERPRIFVQHARQVGICNQNIIFDAGAVRSFCGLRPVRFLWSLRGRSASGARLPVQTECIALNESVLGIPREALSRATVAVEASLTVVTFLGASSTRTFTTLVNTTAIPDIQIQHSPLVRRRDASEIVAIATLSTCGGAVEPSFVFRWYLRTMQQQAGGVAALHDDFEWIDVQAANTSTGKYAVVKVGGLLFTDNRRATLSTKPFTWLPCLSYEVKAVVAFASRGKASVSNFQTAAVEQTRGKVHANIDALDMTITADQAVVLNASSSYDEDGLAPKVNLTFVWKCTNMPAGTPCNVDITGQTSDTLHLRPGTLPARARVKVSVTVSSNAHPVFPCYPKQPRHATDWVVITVAEVPSPNVRLEVCATPLCAEPSPLIQSRAVVNFSPGRAYYLRMSADMPELDPTDDRAAAKCGETLKSYWTSNVETHEFAGFINTRSLTEPHHLPPSRIETFKFSLANPPGAALSASYKFTMKVTANCDLGGKDVQSISEVKFNVGINSPPQLGRLIVTATGTSKPTAAHTIFHLHHEEKWVDPDFPLQYHFGFVVNDWSASTFSSQVDLAAGEHHNLIYLHESPRSSDSLFTMLPMPGECPRREITVVVQVSN